VLGQVVTVTKRVKPSKVTKELSPGYEFLLKGWTEATLKVDKGLIFTTTSSKTGNKWTADEVSTLVNSSFPRWDSDNAL
jgi:hypothetical protein